MLDTQLLTVFHDLNILDSSGPFVYFSQESGAQCLNADLYLGYPSSAHLDEVGTRCRCPEFSENLKITLNIIDASEKLRELVVVEDVINKKELEACVPRSQFLHLACYLVRLFTPVTPPLEIEIAEFACSLHPREVSIGRLGIKEASRGCRLNS